MSNILNNNNDLGPAGPHSRPVPSDTNPMTAKPLDMGERYRAMVPADENFIYSSWMKSYRDASAVSTMSNDVYFFNQQLCIEAVARRCQILVATAPDDPNEIWGYIFYEAGPEGSIIVHYLYVKERFRRFGLGTKILKTAGWIPGNRIWASHWTRPAEVKQQRYNAKHNLYLLFKE